MLDKDKAREELERILDGIEYRVYDQESDGLIARWWEAAKEWLGEILADIFPSFETASNAAGPLLIMIGIIVIGLLGVVTYLLIRNGRRSRRFRDNKPLASMKESNWSYQRHLAEANKLETLEEYSQSTRHMFLALLLYFHEREWLEARIWKTNWEYYDELRRVNREWAEQFYYLALLFDEVTYGERTIKKDEYMQFRTDAMRWLDPQNDTNII
ncbi:DUF4129 domain-containing protein [Fredinandcohnia quinoae]|uniref:DUF4129 domain-containing protein n=1 Tax=Fredinandcohnia quinoae TaxID=2918902 RepID=A0AAW5ED52_9BACI|nr:DUF4129 domain-containing protein [Fredinandcohnia sp. SECRCQ15]MCH1626694.1 DUF4129 domain-containing protein [Fredinandcohnia sp. SECRCQ15]